MNWRAAVVGVILPAGLWLVGTSGRMDGEPALPSDDKAQLVLSEVFWAGMVGPDGPHSGTIIAVWDDGVVVFPRNPRTPDKELQAGRITPAQVTAVLDELKQASFFDDLPGGGVAPDASSWVVEATRDGKTSRYQCMWTDINYYWGATVDATPDARKFARMWTLSRTSVAFAHPAKYVPLAKDPVAVARFDHAVTTRKLLR